MSETVEALVLGGTDYGEADRIVYLLTNHGRTAVFAHGAKKSRTRFGGALDPFTTIAATLDRRRRGGMPTLASAQVLAARTGLRGDLGRIALAAYVVELAGGTCPEGVDAGDVAVLTERTLDHLATARPSLADRRRFELELVLALGYPPTLDRCASCGEALLGEEVGFDLGRGGALCGLCGPAVPRIGPRTRAWLGRALSGTEDAGDPDRQRAAQKLEAPTRGFFESLLGSPPKSLALALELGL